MTKHAADKPHDHNGSRLREYTRQERESGTHPAVDALRKRSHDRSEDKNSRAAEFARIERGQEN